MTLKDACILLLLNEIKKSHVHINLQSYFKYIFTFNGRRNLKLSRSLFYQKLAFRDFFVQPFILVVDCSFLYIFIFFFSNWPTNCDTDSFLIHFNNINSFASEREWERLRETREKSSRHRIQNEWARGIKRRR